LDLLSSFDPFTPRTGGQSRTARTISRNSPQRP
jgi:hypothetical protein